VKQWLFKGVIVVTGMALLWMFRVAIIEQAGQRMMNNAQQLQAQNLERIAAHRRAPGGPASAAGRRATAHSPAKSGGAGKGRAAGEIRAGFRAAVHGAGRLP